MKKNVLLGVALLGIAVCTNVFSAGPVVDQAVYKTIPKNEKYNYRLESKWLYSVATDNYGTPIGTSGYVRGMIAKDGKMYFIDREKAGITVVDGLTGVTEKTITLASNIFTYVDGDGVTQQAGTLPFNDIKIDNAGNVLLGNCITSNAGRFQVWKVDLETGAGTLVLDESTLLVNFPESVIRFDAFGVEGDVDGDATILAANASAMEVYKWEITGGIAGEVGLIEVDNWTEGTLLTGLADPGSAPQVFPLGNNLFYLDGNTTYPTLIDFDGNIMDGFYTDLSKLTDTSTAEGETWTMNEGHNGIIEFEVDGEYFMLMAATNTVRVPFSSFRLFKFADAGKSFANMTCMWTFPQAGMGAASNAYRTAVPSVEVIGNIARLYLYAGENGYGMYEFISELDPNSIDGISLGAGVTISTEGLAMIFSETVATAQIYNVSGQLVSAIANTNTAQVSAQGVYIVKLTTEAGLSTVQKVVVP